MSGLKIDVKGDGETYKKYCGDVDVEKVWRTTREAKRMGVHVEIVNLVVTGVNSDEQTLRWIIDRHLKEVGPETPLHFTRYYPAYKFDAAPTPIQVLEKAYHLAKAAGVSYPYVGNVLGHSYENTYCSSCGEKLIQRHGSNVVTYKITEDKKCPKCGQPIPIHGRYVKKRRVFPIA